jgi:hypothetical protein
MDSSRRPNAGSPRNELEAALAAIWCDVLGLREVGTDDDFFDLGGHSLLAVALATRVRDLIHVEFEVRDVLEQPTIASEAALIARTIAEHDRDGLLAAALRHEQGSPP